MPEDMAITRIYFVYLKNIGIGPKILVNKNLFCRVNKTTEFSKKVKLKPNFDILKFLHRIINALHTSPFNIFKVERRFVRNVLIETMIISPGTAYRLLKPFPTFIHATVFAPELSITFNKVLF